MAGPWTALAVLGLLVPLVGLAWSDYRGSDDLHVAMELIGGVLGLLAGVTLIERYRALGDRAHLLYGLAFFANASADLVHGVVPFLVSRDIVSLSVGATTEAMPATYLVGRTMAAVILLVAPWLTTVPGARRSRTHPIRYSLVALAAGTLASLVIFAVPIPDLLFPQRAVGRPGDLVTAIVFAAAAVMLYRRHRADHDPITWWVAIAAGAGAVGQTVMAFSHRLYDAPFDLAHTYKILGYLVPMVALSLGQVRLLAQRERLAHDLARYARQLEIANEELEHANAIKADLVSVVSHELRTPLTAVLGFTSTLLEFWDSTPDDEKREHLRIVARQGARLGALINDLLAMSRITAGTLDTTLADVDLGEVAARVAAGLADRVPGIEVAVPPATMVRSDPDQLEQILLNYLTNAGKYGRPPIRVAVEDGQPGAVTVVVADVGDGVPPTFRVRLFDQFAQADSGPTRRSQGTGLGLAIVRGLARAQGGDAWYEPNQPTGARFLVRLPKARSARPEPPR